MIAAKNNPFGAKRIQAIGYLPQELSWRQIETRLNQLDDTAAIVGPHGSGKTALLRNLETRLSQCGVSTAMLFINLDIKLPWQTIRNTIESLPPKGVLFFAGANHLPFLRFKQLQYLTRKRHVGLVITSHREGLLPTLTYCRPRLELLTELTERLLGKNEAIEPLHLAALFESHNGNICDCLWQLYDEYAEQKSESNTVLTQGGL